MAGEGVEGICCIVCSSNDHSWGYLSAFDAGDTLHTLHAGENG